jgi:glycerophosphoryl diester phosphodiesterase
MIKLIAHRGIWEIEEEKNSLVAFKKALEKNIHIETDIRDYNGKVHISHDPIINNSNLISLENLLNLHKSLNSKSLLFLNVKSDGLYHLIDSNNEIILKFSYFFDMSFPELIQYDKHGFNYLLRISEFESTPNKKLNFKGFWIDSFKNLNWFFESKSIFLSNKIYAFVSPDLHKFDYLNFWKQLKSIDNNLLLCTDHINEARSFFNE